MSCREVFSVTADKVRVGDLIMGDIRSTHTGQIPTCDLGKVFLVAHSESKRRVEIIWRNAFGETEDREFPSREVLYVRRWV